jgi:uncharacterized protein DUF1629
MLFVILDNTYYDHVNLSRGKLTGIKIMQGVSLAKLVPEVTLRIEDKRPIADYFKSGGCPIVSDLVKNVFDSADVLAEYFPVNIKHIHQVLPGGQYYLLNPLSVVDCVDVKRSVITRAGPHNIVSAIDKLALKSMDEEEFPPLFLAKGYEYIMCASQHLVTKLTGRNVKGMDFVEVPSFTFPRRVAA